MPAVPPSEFPPPFDSNSVIGPPTDAPEDRIEVGVAIVGGGPAGLACANKLMQLLENEPELTEKLGEVPVAVIEKGKVAGAHLLSGANMVPSAMEELFPDLPKEEWPVYQEVDEGRRLRPHVEEPLPAETGPAGLPQPRQLRHLGGETGPLPRRQSRRSRRLHPQRNRRDQAVGRGPGRQGRPLGRPRPWQKRRGAGELRARLGRDRQGDGARRGHGRPPHLRRLRLLRHARLRPDALGARGERGLGGAEAARPGDPHDGLAVASRRPLERVRRQLHLPDGRGQDLHRHGRRPGLHRRHLQRPRRAAAAEDAPLHQEAARGRQTDRLGRQDDPVGRLLRDAEAARGAGHDGRRRRGQHGQHPDPEGRPLRDARRHVRGRNDRRVAEDRHRLGQLRGLRRAGPQVDDREGPQRVAQHAPAVLRRASSSVARSPRR